MSDPRDYSDPRADRHDVGRLHAPVVRESDEPQDGREPVPITWVFAVLALAMWAGWYLGAYHGGFAAAQLDGEPWATAAPTQVAAAPVDPMVIGKRTFNSCAACHQADGRGVPGQFPPLAGSPWVTGSPARLVRILLHGLQGPVVVLGHTYDGVMPAWAKLGDDAIAAVLTYIRASWGNAAGPIAGAEVAAVRAACGDRREAWHAEALLAVLDAPLAAPAPASAAAPAPASAPAPGRGPAPAGAAAATTQPPAAAMSATAAAPHPPTTTDSAPAAAPHSPAAANGAPAAARAD